MERLVQSLPSSLMSGETYPEMVAFHYLPTAYECAENALEGMDGTMGVPALVLGQSYDLACKFTVSVWYALMRS